MNSELKPKIRFKGFTDDWEQRKLENEVTDIIAGGDIDKNNSVEKGKYPIYANALVNDGIVGFYNDYFRVKAPAVTVTGRGEIGHAVARDLDFTPVVRLLSLKSNHYNHFLARAINNLNVVSESTGVPQLTVPQLEKYEIKFPKTLEEEKQIGNIFVQIDNLITLHQRKCDKLVELKKSLLEKMFPQNNSVIPEIRFKGFTDDWEQRKFGEELETITDYVAAGSFADLAANVKYLSNPSYAQLVRTVDIKNNFTSKDNVYVDKNAFNYLWRVNLKDECIIMPNIGNCGEIYLLNQGKLKYKNNVLGPNAILVRSKKNDNKFLSFDFQTKEFQDRLKLIISPNGQTKFNKTELKTIDLIVPNKDEQLKIGKTFSQIDNLITLHQRKHDKLNKIKQSLLNDMFV